MADIIKTPTPASVDPSMVLTFNGKDGSEVAITLTLTANGDIRNVWEDFADMGEREALHYLAGQLFQDVTRDVN